LTSGTTNQRGPAVSPDGSKLVFSEATSDFDVVSVDLATTAVTPLIATQRSEQMPAWAAREASLVYATNRNGEMEIWLRRPAQPDRPLVTLRDFPADTTQWFMNPVLSPDGARVIYTRVERGGAPGLWMSAVAGGAPVRLLKSAAAAGYAGSWSPDGKWFVYWALEGGRTSLNKVKTTGQAEPEVLKAGITGEALWVPVWSPTGEWILHADGGPKLTSPDGRTTRELPSRGASVYGFSADGQTIYGMRAGPPDGRVELFSLPVSGGHEKTIGFLTREFAPNSSLSPSRRVTLTPDGKALTYSIGRNTSNLWLMDGLDRASK
jgi:Tol biopolymer transport system component